MKSGVPVLGSIAAQSIETLCVDGENGWVFEPNDTDSIYESIERAFATTPEKLREMGDAARASVDYISAKYSADEFMKILKFTAATDSQTGRQSIESMVQTTEGSLAR